MKIVQIMAHRPNVPNHPQLGETRHLVRGEEAVATRALVNEDAKNLRKPRVGHLVLQMIFDFITGKHDCQTFFLATRTIGHELHT